MPPMSHFLLPSCYLAPLPYYSILLNSASCSIDEHEYFVKQSYRNRCEIYGANGKLKLIVPLHHEKEKTPHQLKRISYAEPWQKNHWKSIESAYRSSPYFEFFEEELKNIFFTKHEFLFQMNRSVLLTIMKLMKAENNIEFSTSWERNPDKKIDMRSELHGNSSFIKIPNDNYYQVFAQRMGFIPNLSIIDLLFNTGLEGKKILAGIYSAILKNYANE